jgi:hypothetical protein
MDTVTGYISKNNIKNAHSFLDEYCGPVITVIKETLNGLKTKTDCDHFTHARPPWNRYRTAEGFYGFIQDGSRLGSDKPACAGSGRDADHHGSRPYRSNSGVDILQLHGRQSGALHKRNRIYKQYIHENIKECS